MPDALYKEVAFRTAGDRGVLVEYGEGIDPEVNRKVRIMAMVLDRYPVAGVIAVVPTYRALLIQYDPTLTSLVDLKKTLLDLEDRLSAIEIPSPRTVEIPVCYGGDFGPDIEFVAKAHHLSVDDVIRLHSAPVYPIYMIGFTPGFPFLGGLPEKLHTPRLETPRTHVPEGSVGIANAQTGIYPVASPGGWQLIGRTPLKLFVPEKENPFLYRAGDCIQFRPIVKAAYDTFLTERGGLMEVFKVVTPGAYTTVQDAGRFGFQQMGVPVSGALDDFAFQVANFLVGNPRHCAALEITIMGPRLEVMAEVDIAVTGANMPISHNGVSVPGWSNLRVQPGDVIDIHQVENGCRAYLAVSGGFDVPTIMGSRSTYVGGRLGGFAGRPLAAADILAADGPVSMYRAWQLPEKWIPEYPGEILVRAIPGPQDQFFDQGLATLFSADYMVTAKADRMGYRLQGPAIDIRADMPSSIVSEPSMPGSIQIPADAQPIILFVEQTVGGYAKIATVISVDLFRVAQATPGDTIRFESINLEDAHLRYREHQDLLAQIADYLR